MIASILFAATVAPLCLVAGAGENARTVIAGPETTATLARNGPTVAACPADLNWTAEAAYDQCQVLRNYSDDARKSFQELYGLSTDDACNAGLNAANAKPVKSTKGG